MERKDHRESDSQQLNRSRKMECEGPQDFLKKLGKGKTLSKSLSYNEAQLAMSQILDSKFTPAQLGALLQAWRLVELTQEELNAMGAFLLGQLKPIEPPQQSHTLVLNICSDTARKGGILAASAAHLLCLWPVDVCIVANMPMLSNNTRSLSLSLDCGEKALEFISAKKNLSTFGSIRVSHCDDLIEQWCLLEGVRQELGFRSCLHTLEKLVSPWPQSPFITALSHKHYAQRMAKALAHLKMEDSCILMGNHGTIDLNLHKKTESYFPHREEAFFWDSPADVGLEIPSQLYTLQYMDSWKKESKDLSSSFWNGVQYELSFLLIQAKIYPNMEVALQEIRKKLAI